MAQARRPNGSGPIPKRSIRVPDDLWQAAQAVAAARGETVSHACNGFLERYAKEALSHARQAG